MEDILPGDFVIRDFGYYSLKVIDGIKRWSAFFLLRLMTSVAVFDHKGKEVDFKKIYQKMKRYDIPQMEMDVFIGVRDRIGVRLSISLASEEVYQRRLDKLKKANERRKDNISESSRNRLRLNLFITNVPQDVLPSKDM